MALIYFVFRMLKSSLSRTGFSRTGLGRTGNIKHNAHKKAGSGGVAGEIDDVMVQDPFCKVYFPKRDAHRLRYDGTELYFCSEECKNKFIELQK